MHPFWLGFIVGVLLTAAMFLTINDPPTRRQ
jgi:hypothetical protein